MDTDYIQSRTDRKTEKKTDTEHREREQTKSAGGLLLAKIQQKRRPWVRDRETQRQRMPWVRERGCKSMHSNSKT